MTFDVPVPALSGWLLSWFVRDTAGHVRLESSKREADGVSHERPLAPKQADRRRHGDSGYRADGHGRRDGLRCVSPLWRDLGYVAGALVAGVLSDILGISTATTIIGLITAGSGVVVALRLKEPMGNPGGHRDTHHRQLSRLAEQD